MCGRERIPNAYADPIASTYPPLHLTRTRTQTMTQTPALALAVTLAQARPRPLSHNPTAYLHSLHALDGMRPTELRLQDRYLVRVSVRA